MTTVKKMSLWDGVRYMWVHARPHTKRMRLRFTAGMALTLTMKYVTVEFHFPGWLSIILTFGALLYTFWEFLVFMAGEASWEARKKEEQLNKLLASPDLSQRFAALRVRLPRNDAEQLGRLQEAMTFGAREAQRLADEIRGYEGITNEIRERQEKDRQAAEALAKLLDCEVGRVAEMIERKGRRSQWILLIAGAILGVIFQFLAQWIF